MEPPKCPSVYEAYPATPMTFAGIPTTIYTHPSFSLHIPTTKPVHLLILLHPLFRRQEFFSGLSRRLIGDFYAEKTRGSDDHFVVITVDQRNHGARIVDRVRNVNWSKGNDTYALDLLVTYTGTARDVEELLDLVLAGGYTPALKDATPYVGGVSLGGHASWATVLDDERIRGAGVVIGCGDYGALMTHRAEIMGWGGVVGHGLEKLMERFDLRTMVDTKGVEFVSEKLRGKKILTLEGLSDEDVPSACSAEVYAKVQDAGVALKIRRFEGVKHVMNDEMCDVYSEWWRAVFKGEDITKAKGKI